MEKNIGFIQDFLRFFLKKLEEILEENLGEKGNTFRPENFLQTFSSKISSVFGGNFGEKVYRPY